MCGPPFGFGLASASGRLVSPSVAAIQLIALGLGGEKAGDSEVGGPLFNSGRKKRFQLCSRR